jgi:Ca2+-binding EF-hand superfamily protein
LDKNNDRKITVEDVQIMLQETGLGFLSKYVAQALFDMVDSNHDGKLQFRDFVALMGIIKQLISAVGSAKVKT